MNGQLMEAQRVWAQTVPACSQQLRSWRRARWQWLRCGEFRGGCAQRSIPICLVDPGLREQRRQMPFQQRNQDPGARLGVLYRTVNHDHGIEAREHADQLTEQPHSEELTLRPRNPVVSVS